MRPTYWLLILVAAFGWGTGGIATRAAFSEGVGPWTVVGARLPIAAVVVVAFLMIRRSPRPTRSDMRIGSVQAVVNVVAPFILMALALQYASAGFVGLLVALVPLATSVFAHFLLPDEPMTRAKLAALSVAFAGVSVLMLSGDSGLTEDGRPILAAALALLAVAAVGFAGTHAKRHAGTYDPTMLAGVQFAVAAPVLVLGMLAFEGLPLDLSTLGWILIIYMALVSTVLPFLVYFWLLQHITATQGSLVAYIVPFVGLFGGILLLDERLESGIVLGGVLVVAGMFLSDREGRKRGVELVPEKM